MKKLSLITLSMLLCAAARAELKWEQTTIELHPAINDKQAVAHFLYQNVGKTSVRFKSVHASCGCTAAQSQKEQVGPGEKGEITATFNIGDRTGTQVKTVSVETDEVPNTMTTLTLKAVLPQPLSLAPAFIFWNSGEEAKPKTIVAKADKDLQVKDLKVTPSSAAFEVQVQPNGGHEWKINVTPKNTAQPVNGILNIIAELPNAPTRTFYANVRVMPSTATQAAPSGSR
jgi:hypothetical protein